LDLNAPRDALEYVSGITWPYGTKSLHYRIKNQGVEAILGETWFPSHPGEHGILLQEGSVVSPAYFLYFQQALNIFYSDPTSTVLGICLRAPHIANAVPAVHLNDPDLYFIRPFPCLSGALFLPQAWADVVHDNTLWLLQQPINDVPLSGISKTQPGVYFDKFIKNLMEAKDLFMIYPNFARAPLMLSVGETLAKGGTIMELPSEGHDLESSNIFDLPLSFRVSKVYDTLGQRVISLNCLLQGASCFSKFQETIRPVKQESRGDVCKSLANVASAFNVPKDSDKITIIIDQAKDVDLSLIAKQIEYYAKVSNVATIIVAFDGDGDVPVPPTVQIDSVFVTFTPRSLQSKNSRFFPLSKITTDCVIQIGAGVRVHLEDIDMMHKVWTNNQEHLVGVYPSMYTVTNGRSAYSMMKTSFVIIHSRFFESYSCDEEMAFVRNKVDHFQGCEDIALNLHVMRSTHMPSPLFVHPLHRVISFSERDKAGTVEPNVYRECIDSFSRHLLGSSVDGIPSQKNEIMAKWLSNFGTRIELEVVTFDDSNHIGNRHRHDVEVQCVFDKQTKAWKIKESSRGMLPLARDSEEEESWCNEAWTIGDSRRKDRFEYEWSR